MPTKQKKIENAKEQIRILRTRIKKAREHIIKINDIERDRDTRNNLITKWNAKIALLSGVKDKLLSAITVHRDLITGSSENSIRDIENMSSTKLSDSSGGKSRRKYKSRKRRTRRNR